MPILARLALLLALAGCTAHRAKSAPSLSQPGAPRDARVGSNSEAMPLAPARATPSERLRWTITIRGVELARLTMTSRPIAHLRGRAQIVSTASTSGIGSWFRYVDRRTVTVSAGQVPVSAWAQKRDQRKWRRVHTRFNATSVDVIIEQKGGRWRARRIDGLLWRMTNAGTVESRRAPRAVTIWLSDDKARRPLRFEADTKYGTIVCEFVLEPDA